MKPMISLFAVMAMTLTAIAGDGKMSDHIKETGPNPMCFNGNVAEAKIYFKDAEGQPLAGYTKYTFKSNDDYSMEVWNHQERVSYTSFETNAEGTQQNKIVEGEHAERRNRTNVLENGNVVKELYADATKDEVHTLKTFTYDEQGRLSTVNHWDDAANGTSEMYIYGDNHIIRKFLDKDGIQGRTDTYLLDQHHNPVKITISDGWGKQEPKVFTFKYTYDNHSNYTQVEMYRDGKLMNTQYREIQYN